MNALGEEFLEPARGAAILTARDLIGTMTDAFSRLSTSAAEAAEAFCGLDSEMRWMLYVQRTGRTVLSEALR